MQEFNDILTQILDKFFRENKERHEMGEFNINLMNYETDNLTSHFLDNVCSGSFFPHIHISTRHISRSKSLIENILHNGIDGSENITTNISDHLA